jgi:ABC-type transport system involved in multi-copper enzyme maturation permease subunit
MEHVITRDFSITRDFKSIAWGATLWHNILRSACAGVVLGLLVLITGANKGSENPAIVFAMPFVFPLLYILVYMPVGLICAFIARFFPPIALITFVIALFFVMAGDPLVWLISLIAPRVVPVAKPGFLNLALIMWVLKPEDAVEVTITNTSAAKQL